MKDETSLPTRFGIKLISTDQGGRSSNIFPEEVEKLITKAGGKPGLLKLQHLKSKLPEDSRFTFEDRSDVESKTTLELYYQFSDQSNKQGTQFVKVWYGSTAEEEDEKPKKNTAPKTETSSKKESGSKTDNVKKEGKKTKAKEESEEEEEEKEEEEEEEGEDEKEDGEGEEEHDGDDKEGDGKANQEKKKEKGKEEDKESNKDKDKEKEEEEKEDLRDTADKLLKSLPKERSSKVGQSEMHKRGQLPSDHKERGKLSEENVQELLKKVGGDIDAMNQMKIGESSGVQDMSAEDWSAVEKDLGYLYGYYPDSRKEHFLKAGSQAFSLRVKTNKKAAPSSDQEVEGGYVIERQIPPYYTSGLEGHINVTSYRSKEEKEFALSGFNTANTNVALGVALPKIQLGASASQDSTTETAYRKTETKGASHVVAVWEIPVISILFSPASTEIHPDCKQRLEELRTNGTYAMAIDFFRDYGTTYSTRITIGGKLHSSQEVTSQSDQVVQEAVSNLKRAVDGSIGGGDTKKIKVGAKLKAGHSSEKSNSNYSIDNKDMESTQLAWSALGGELINAHSPAKWLPTVANFTKWRVIEHVEVKSMIHAFDNYKGFEGTSSVFLALLSYGNTLKTKNLPWLPSMSEAMKGFEASDGPLGYSLSTTDLTRSFNPPFSFNEKDVQKTFDRETSPKISWKVLGTFKQLEEYIKDTLAVEGTKKPEYGVNPLPEQLYHLDISERSFTVVLNINGPEKVAKIDPKSLNFTKEALGVIQRSKKDNLKAFNEVYGDRFVTGWTIQQSMLAIFRIKFDRIHDFEIARVKLGHNKLSEKQSVEDGFGEIEYLLKKDGINISSTTLITKYDSEIKGFEVEEYVRLTLTGLWGIKSKYSNVDNSDEYPINLFTNSFLELLPHLDFPDDFIFGEGKGLDETKKKKSSSDKMKRINCITNFIQNSSQARLHLLEDKSETKIKLQDDIKKIVEQFKTAERNLKGMTYSPSEQKELDNITKSFGNDILEQFAVCRWVRQNIALERSLYGEENPSSSNPLIPTLARPGQVFAAPLDWGKNQVDSKIFEPIIVDRIMGKVQSPKDTLAGTPTTVNYTSTSPSSEKHKLVYWQVSRQGRDANGRFWYPVNGNDEHWKSNQDTFVWKHSPKIAHFPEQDNESRWKLITYWLNRDDYPFNEDYLFDFEFEDQKHLKLPKAFVGQEAIQLIMRLSGFNFPNM